MPGRVVTRGDMHTDAKEHGGLESALCFWIGRQEVGHRARKVGPNRVGQRRRRDTAGPDDVTVRNGHRTRVGRTKEGLGVQFRVTMTSGTGVARAGNTCLHYLEPVRHTVSPGTGMPA